MSSHLSLRILSLFFGISSVLACSSSDGGVPSNSAGSAGNNALAGSGGAGSGGIGSAGTGGGGTPDTPADCRAGNGPVNSAPRTECMAPASSRNLFSEVLCKSAADVQDKMNGLVQQLFHGTGQDQPIYYQLSANASQAYIEDIASGDVRSEGQSYGMFIAVHMNMRSEFDKLWAYAKACMQQPSGVFAWQMNVDSCTPKSTGQAPDGDEYFAEALRLADRRWGSTGAINYASEAKKIMEAIAKNDFSSNPAIVKFSQNSNFSDPSYVLPLFYSEWACFDSANAALWRNATSYARTYFPKVYNASTGLSPYQSNFDGSAYQQGNTFNADAWHVPNGLRNDARRVLDEPRARHLRQLVLAQRHGHEPVSRRRAHGRERDARVRPVHGGCQAVPASGVGPRDAFRPVPLLRRHALHAVDAVPHRHVQPVLLSG